MSYARFACDSGVYVFLSCDGALECCGCNFTFPRYHFRAFTTRAMLNHLLVHEAAGHMVPESCRRGLLADAAENDRWIRLYALGEVSA